MNSQKKKTLVIFLITLFALNLLAFSGFADARTTTINVYAGESIQTHVNEANPGDTIVVHAGTYQEMVSIGETLTLKGDGAIIQTPDFCAFYIHGTGVKITGFNIQPLNNGVDHQYGIYLDGANGEVNGNEITTGFSIAAITVQGPSGTMIKNNIITSSTSGIYGVIVGSPITIAEGANILIANNQIQSGPNGIDGSSGIWLNILYGSAIIKNNDVQSDCAAIKVISAPAGCKISGNTLAAGNGYSVIEIALSSNVVIDRNIIQNTFTSGRGIDVFDCSNVKIQENNVNTKDAGIVLNQITVGSITNNEVNNNYELAMDGWVPSSFGIFLYAVTDCGVSNNNVLGGEMGLGVMISQQIIIKYNQFTPDDHGGPNGEWLSTGISFSGVTDSKIAENKIAGQDIVGIYIHSGSTSNNIVRNTISIGFGFGIGIALDSGTSANLVKGNMIYGADTNIQDDSNGLNIIQQ
jgi:hypothetical protein